MRWLLFMSLFTSLPLIAQIKVLALAGSTRYDAYNKKLISEAAEVARQRGAKVTLIDLRDYSMPLYDADLEMRQKMPNNAKAFKKLLTDNDAVMISSPEYNGSIPAVLKNAIDWATRTEDGQGSREAFQGKKFAIMSTSPSQRGGKRALVHLQAILEAIGAEVIPIQVSVPNAPEAFNEKGQLKNPALKQQLEDEVNELIHMTQGSLKK